MTAQHYREYTFVCLCGLHVKGRYRLTEDDFDRQTRKLITPLDKTKAVCSGTRGAPSFPASSIATRKSVEPHAVGCGRTLAEVDAARGETVAR